MKPFIQSRQLGFSLTELLVVIAVMAGLAVASVPALTSMNSSGKTNQAVAEVAGLLEQARQYAIAQNTYVWVAFYEESSSATGNTVSVAVMASKDGTDPTSLTPTYNFGAIPSSTASVNLISPMRTFNQLSLADAGSLAFTGLPTATVNSSRNSLAKNRATFQLKPSGFSSAVPFTRYVQFTPGGEARNTSGPIDIVEIGMQPRGQANKNLAVLRISGLTGLTQVYHP